MWFLSLVLVCVVQGITQAQESICPGNMTRCQYQDWGEWGPCSRTCGEGTRTRSRGLCCRPDEVFDDCVKDCGLTNDTFQSESCLFVCPTVCKSTAEVAFVLDSSGSVGADNFDKMKEFSQNVTVSLDAYYDKLNVTLISFNLHPTIQIHKDEFDKTKDVLAAMSTLVYTHGGTNTHEALDLMYNTSFHKHSNGAKIAIVVTDGASFEPTLTKAAALTAKQGGVIIFVVGVGDDVNTKELSFISSDPDDKFLYILSNFSGLPEAVQNIIGLFPHISCVAPISTDASTPPSTEPSTAKSTPTTTSPSTPSTTTQSTTTTTMETTSTTPGTTTTASCVAKIADVVFVVDASGSIGIANFQKIKEFIKSVINTFDIGSRYTRVGLIEFSTYPHIEFKLNDHPHITELLEAVDNINYSGGGTSTSDALELMRQEGFDRERQQAPDIAIIITDGLSKYPSLTRAQAQLAKNEGINLFAIGIGNDTQTDELKAIASRNLFFEVGDFDTLSSIDMVIGHSTCGVNLPEVTHTRSTEAPVTAPHGCMDIASECDTYHRDTCSDYEPYARQNCAKKCGFCDAGGSNETKECKDELSMCSYLGTSRCTQASQYDWVDYYCRKFCGFCGSKVDLIKTTAIPTTTTPGTTTEWSCKDEIGNCKDYGGPSMCKTYSSWARSNCAKYCSFCRVYETVTSVTVNKVKCPEWQLPVECTLDYSTGSCCPMPNCPNGFRLTVERNLS